MKGSGSGFVQRLAPLYLQNHTADSPHVDWFLRRCPLSQRRHKSWVGLIDLSADPPSLVSAPLPRITAPSQVLGRFDYHSVTVSQCLSKSWVGLID
jgi:hypothetical protein